MQVVLAYVKLSDSPFQRSKKVYSQSYILSLSLWPYQNVDAPGNWLFRCKKGKVLVRKSFGKKL